MKVAYVKWIDSSIIADQVPRKIASGIATVRSYGRLIKETKQGVVVARDTMDDDVRGTITIPWCNVREYRVGTVKRLARKRVRK